MLTWMAIQWYLIRQLRRKPRLWLRQQLCLQPLECPGRLPLLIRYMMTMMAITLRHRPCSLRQATLRDSLRQRDGIINLARSDKLLLTVMIRQAMGIQIVEGRTIMGTQLNLMIMGTGAVETIMMIMTLIIITRTLEVGTVAGEEGDSMFE